MKFQRIFKQQKIKKEETGFTLIELLVASSLLALTTVISWRGVDMVLKTKVRITNNEYLTESVEKTFVQLDFDINNVATLKTKSINSISLFATSFVVVRKTSLNKAVDSDQYKNTGYKAVLYTIINTDLWRVTSPIIYSEEDIIETLKLLSTYSPNNNNEINNKKLIQTLMIQGIADFDVNVFLQKNWQTRLDYSRIVAQVKLENKTVKNEGIKYKITMVDGESFNKTTTLAP